MGTTLNELLQETPEETTDVEELSVNSTHFKGLSEEQLNGILKASKEEDEDEEPFIETEVEAEEEPPFSVPEEVHSEPKILTPKVEVVTPEAEKYRSQVATELADPEFVIDILELAFGTGLSFLPNSSFENWELKPRHKKILMRGFKLWLGEKKIKVGTNSTWFFIAVFGIYGGKVAAFYLSPNKTSYANMTPEEQLDHDIDAEIGKHLERKKCLL